MSLSSWWIPPVANVRDGLLHPYQTLDGPLPREAQLILAAGASLRLQSGTLLLRGGLLEQYTPHRHADLDLILLAYPGITVDLSPLRAFGRQLDALRLDPEAPDLVLSTLAFTRALPIAGQPFNLRPIRVDETWLDAHWFRYGALHQPSKLSSFGVRRVSEVKQLVRAAGLLRVWTQGEWSRDLSTCAAWIIASEPGLRPLIESMLSSLNESDPAAIDVGDLQTWLRSRWRQRPTGRPYA